MLYFRAILDRICRADNQKLYIKSNVDQILDIKEDIAHQIELGVGDIKCLERECASINQTYTKSNDNLSRGAYFTNLLDI